MNKKLQVFVSSTYTDLIEERQSAVQAILDAGHIPAGMELFKAGNQSQLSTIYKWIDESDVYMLILGGRYGSIDTESSMSYTELEYRYAIKKKIPVFAVVLNNSWLTEKAKQLDLSNVIEQDEPSKYQLFKKFVMSKIIKPVEDCKDIKIVIHSTLNEFINQYKLKGWIRNTPENDTTQLLSENNSLMKQNLALNNQIQKLKDQINTDLKEKIGIYTFSELIEIFNKKQFVLPAKLTKGEEIKISALKFYTVYFDNFVTGVTNQYGTGDDTTFIFYSIAPYFVGFDLLSTTKIAGTTAQRIQTTKLGAKFYSMLEAKNMTNLK